VKQKLDLESPVRFLPGVGPVRQRHLENIGVSVVRDLLYTFPRRYEDRRSLTVLSDLKPGITASVIARVLEVKERQARKRKMTITTALVTDGASVAETIWFNRRGLQKILFSGSKVALYGRIDRKYTRFQIINPEFELIDEKESAESIGRIIPVYPSTTGINQRWLRKTVAYALEHYIALLEDVIPGPLQEQHGLISLKKAVLSLHYPRSRENWKQARRRMVYEEFLVLQTGLAMRKKRFVSGPAEAPLCTGERSLSDRYIKEILPFSMTKAQQKVLEEIRQDMSKPFPMHRLLQGDVGSGKTAVAVTAILTAVENGYQAAFMAPTEILARQHYETLKEPLSSLGIDCEFLSGSAPSAERARVLGKISKGDTWVIAGTHSLFQEDVNYRSLGLVIVDEQHRFGVMQRQALKSKGKSPHTLVMTATPIPRTLTLSVYGDLSVSVIDEMPPGRQKTETRWVKPDNISRLFEFLEKQVGRGRQVYWVCPLIEESEKIKATSLEERFQNLRRAFCDLSVEMLHGQLNSSEKEEIMKRFKTGETDILVSTTVIEVGVDVPNATIIVIEGAERYGLSQLHQLRGRVGRGNVRSYCVLLSDPGSSEGLQRIKTMCSTSDGFEIAEADLKLRGPGEVCGLRQHGVTDFKIADLVRDRKILYQAREDAFRLVEQDPGLETAELLKRRVINDLGEVFLLVETG
jgi:ATP-dependent DNA helicase RecG